MKHSPMRHGLALAAVLAAAPVFTILPSTTVAIASVQETVLDLTWGKLVPVTAQKDLLRSKSFLSGTGSMMQGSEPATPPPTADDKPWMSQKALQPGRGASQTVPELEGKKIRIGGYVVPLDFDATTVKEFLLVPFVGACIHVPPPPPNQIIYVKTETGFNVADVFDPVYVTGTLHTENQYTGLADTGYTLKADKVSATKD